MSDTPTIRISLLTVVLATSVGSLPAQTRWTVDPRPILEIASESQGSATLFNNIEHVEQLRTGEILVVDGVTRELRFFGADGRFRRKVGRDGAGPGEYRTIAGVVVSDGQVNVFDAVQARITRMDLSGGSLTTLAISPPPEPARGIWSYTLGGFLGRRPVFLASGFPARNSGRPRYTDSLPQFIYTPDGATAKRIGEMAVMDAYFESPQKKGDLLFGRFSASAVGGGRLFVTDRGTFSVRAYDAAGTLVGTFTRDVQPQRITDADFEEYVSLRHQFVPSTSRGALRVLLAAIPRAEFKPAISRLLVDDAGNLWAEHWTVNPDGRPSTWSVFDASGRLRAEATLPRGFRPSTIRGGVVAGVQVDEDDVEGVRFFRLRR